jgi:glycosyltransferase involved in cell wall biosynthesis
MAAPDRIRVLMLMNAVQKYPGGGERFAVGLATHLPADRYEVVFCTTRAHGPHPLLDELRAAGVEHVALGRRHRADLRPWLRLARLLRQRRFHVLHAHMFGSNVWGTVYGRLMRVPAVVAHEQTWSFEGQPLRRLLDRELISRFADTFVAVAERDKQRMIEVEGIPPDRIVVMPNAYIPRRARNGTNLREELGLGSDVPLVGTVAVLRAQKALPVLLDAFARVAEALPEAHLVIGGEGEERPGLEARSRELGIAGRTHFVGYREDVAGVLRALDVAVLSSDYEGSPLFAFECMAHRAMLVSTDVGAVRDVLEDGESVLLVPRRDSAAMAQAIERALRSPELRASLAAAAAKRLARFEMPAIAARFAELYEALIAAPGRRRREA